MIRMMVMWDDNPLRMMAAAMVYGTSGEIICQHKSFTVYTLEELKAYMDKFHEEHPDAEPFVVPKDEMSSLLLSRCKAQQELEEIEERINELKVKGITHEPDSK